MGGGGRTGFVSSNLEIGDIICHHTLLFPSLTIICIFFGWVVGGVGKRMIFALHDCTVGREPSHDCWSDGYLSIQVLSSN
jgi:hypothetical protein